MSRKDLRQIITLGDSRCNPLGLARRSLLKGSYALWLAVPAFLMSILNVYVIMAKSGDIRSLYTSDVLQLTSLYRDLVGGNSPSTWVFGNAPYFFPDVVLYWALSFISGNDILALALLGIVQYLLFILGLVLVSTRLTQSLGTTVLILDISALLTTLPLKHNHTLSMAPVMPVHHFGIIVTAVWSLYFILRLLERDSASNDTAPSYFFLAALFGLTTLSVLSDLLFVIQLVLPAISAIVILSLLEIVDLKQAVWVILTLLLATALGRHAYRWIFIEQDFWMENVLARTVDWQSIATKVETGRYWVSILLQGVPAFVLIWVAFYATCIGIIVQKTINIVSIGRTPEPDSHEVFFLASFFILALTASFLSILLLGTEPILEFDYTDRALLNLRELVIRRALPVFIFPISFGWIMLFGKSVKKYLSATAPWLAIATLAILWMNVPQPGSLSSLNEYVDYYPDYVECLDRNTQRLGISSGISNYWNAKHLSELSNNRLNVAAVSPTGFQPLLFLDNPARYQDEFEFIIADVPEGTDFNPDASILSEAFGSPNFLFLSQNMIFESRVKQLFGKPAVTFDCRSTRVLVYNRESDQLFRDFFFESSLAFTQLDEPGDQHVFYGAMLPGEVGSVSGAGRRANTDSRPGYLTFGPFVSLVAGSYQFEIHYRTEDCAVPRVGLWDVYSTSDHTVLLSGEITGLYDENVITGNFDIEDEKTVEIRTIFERECSLTVEKIVLRHE